MKKLHEPTHSLDPVDWSMFSDLLQDAGEPEAKWPAPRRLAESLAQDPKLVLINYCPARPLHNHWLLASRKDVVHRGGRHLHRGQPPGVVAAGLGTGGLQPADDDPDRKVES